MRAILIGNPRQRHRLREQLDSAPDIVAEFETLAAARDARVVADAFVLPVIAARNRNDHEALSEPLTSREIDVLENLIESGVNGILTDRPDVLLQLLSELDRRR